MHTIHGDSKNYVEYSMPDNAQKFQQSFTFAIRKIRKRISYNYRSMYTNLHSKQNVSIIPDLSPAHYGKGTRNLLHIIRTLQGTCFILSSCQMNACTERSCLKGSRTTLKVPSKYIVLALWRMVACSSKQNMCLQVRIEKR